MYKEISSYTAGIIFQTSNEPKITIVLNRFFLDNLNILLNIYFKYSLTFWFQNRD